MYILYTKSRLSSDNPLIKKLEFSFQLTQPENKAFVNIASAVSSMTEDTVDAYWVTTKFYRVYRKHADVLHSLVSGISLRKHTHVINCHISQL